MNLVLDYIFYFFFYSFAGWVLETVCCSFYYKKYINRGFLAGPMCPIYGTGAVVLGSCLMPIYDKFGTTWYMIPVVIILGIILADIVEYLTSYIMEKLFNARWWDYSNEFLNLHGRICLKHSMYWGAATGVFVYLIHPAVVKNLHVLLTDTQRNQILIMTAIIFFIDLFFAVKASFDVKKAIDKINKLHNTISEKIEELREGKSDSKSFRKEKWYQDFSKLSREADKFFHQKDKTDKKIPFTIRRMINASNSLKTTITDKIKASKKMIDDFSQEKNEKGD